MAVTTADRYPLSLWQHHQLRQLTDPICTPVSLRPWLLAFATQIRPQADRRRLGRAFQKLVRRHDTLRLRFIREDGRWQGVMNPISDYDLVEMDLGEIADDAAFQAEVQRVARQPMDILQERLVELVLLKCGSRGDVVVWRIHHALTDGYGMVVLAEDLFKYMLGMPILSNAVSHMDYLSRWQGPKGAEAARVEAYWQRMAAEAPPAPEVGRKAHGLPPLHMSVGFRDTLGMSASVTPDSATRLMEEAARRGILPQNLVFGAFLESLCRIYGMDRMIFSFFPARTEPALANYCGDHTLDPFVIYRADRGGDAFERAGRLHHQVLEAIGHLPANSARRGSRLERQMIDAGVYPRQFATYSPRATRREKTSAFKRSFEVRPGETMRFGAHSFTPLAIDREVDTIDELQVIGMDDLTSCAFGLGWDIDAYEAAEMEALAQGICDLLGLELTAAPIL
ncbi:MAG: hypothetical protein GYB53_11255 [Rhodobacteraceae bacterium]|nr:hypothetical protein [Paracoccaceae bacterium]MBR9819789.1 hypothetical protein [Paracoccaceae bacterium]